MKHTETTETEKELTTTSSSTQPTKSPRHRGFRKFGVAIAAVLSLVGLSAAVVGIVTSSASAESDQNEQKSFNLNELDEDNIVSTCSADAFSKVLGIDTSNSNSNAFLTLSKGDGLSMSIADGDTTTVVSSEQQKEIRQEIQDCLAENPEALEELKQQNEELKQQRIAKFCTRDDLPEAASAKCAEGPTARDDVGARGEMIKGAELGEGIQPGLDAEDIEEWEPGDVADIQPGVNLEPGVEPGESALL